MLILLDCDGPCAQFVNHLLAQATLGRLVEEDIKTWDIFDYLSEIETKTAEILLERELFWDGIPPVPAAQTSVAELRRQGHEIHWVTSPWYSCWGWESIRRDWLKQHFDATFGDITFTYKKDLLVAGDVLIDDRASHVTNWLKSQENHGRPPFYGYLYDMPHNQNEEINGLRSARVDWPFALDAIAAMGGWIRE